MTNIKNSLNNLKIGNMPAIEWLMEEITYDYGGGERHNSFIDTVDLSEYFNQAREIEKQQKLMLLSLDIRLDMMIMGNMVNNIMKNNLKRNNNDK